MRQSYGAQSGGSNSKTSLTFAQACWMMRWNLGRIVQRVLAGSSSIKMVAFLMTRSWWTDMPKMLGVDLVLSRYCRHAVSLYRGASSAFWKVFTTKQNAMTSLCFWKNSDRFVLVQEKNPKSKAHCLQTFLGRDNFGISLKNQVTILCFSP